MFKREKLVLAVAILLCVFSSSTAAFAATEPLTDESAAEAVSLNNMAVTSAREHRYEEAIDLLKRAIALQPDQYMAHYNLGCLFQVKQNFDLAIGAFKETLRLKPEFADAYHHLGVSYNQTKQYADAIESFTARFTWH